MIDLFYNLLSSGFHLSESISFLKRSCLLPEKYTDHMEKGLLEGASFSKILEDLGFSSSVTTQVALAEQHGHLTHSLLKISDYLKSLSQVRNKLVEVLTYPLILLLFLILMMIGLKNYLIPQMEDENLATQLIGHLPTIFLLLFGSVLVLVYGATLYFRKSKKILVCTRLSRLPLVGPLIQLYLTAYYAREWGNLIDQGLDLATVVSVMTQQRSRLFQELGEEFTKALASGRGFHNQVALYPFFRRELPLMIEYGDAKGKLGKELVIYAERCWKDFFRRLHQKMQWIQPMVFLFVALIIVLIYVAMLLPIYQNMEF
ncbi:Late competence protein ComGB, access of DNA to ComEA [Streptococcus sp. DD13]|nr:Late competence protein ComGB, access of DNA to ComEA [Streptococcus sp. DD13]